MSTKTKLNPQQHLAAYALGNGIDKKVVDRLSETDNSYAYRYKQYNNILVSAAAGSGKTAILVERVKNNIQLGMKIDEMLISTFTIEAAKNMKSRIENLLEANIPGAAKEDKEKYETAIRDINKAQISTLHSFCLEVIQKNYQKLGLSPNLRSLDEVERDVIVETIIEEVLEKGYAKVNKGEKVEGIEEFITIANIISVKGREGFVEKIKSIMDVALANANKDTLITNFKDNYGVTYETLKASIESNEKHVLETRYRDLLIGHCYRMIEIAKGMKDDCKQLNKIIDTHELLVAADEDVKQELKDETETYKQNIEEALKDIKEIKEKFESDNFNYLEITYNFLLPESPNITKTKMKKLSQFIKTQHIDNAIVEDFFESIEKLRSNSKSKNRKKYMYYLKFAKDIESMQEINNDFLQYLDVLVKITACVIKKFEAYKKAHNLIDFSDYEHFTLQLLSDHEDVRSYYHYLFKEIMIDEYQDFNRVQEAIISKIKEHDKKNENDCQTTVFMVGDVKQSIYQFRQADPELFNEKYASALDFDKYNQMNDPSLYVKAKFIEDGQAEAIISPDFMNETFQKSINNLVIELNLNYRSSQSVIDFTNKVFEHIMLPERGGIDYSNGHKLKLGRKDESSAKCDVELIGQSEDKQQAIADYIVKTIKRLQKTDCNFNYSNVAILTSARTNHQFYNKALDEQGIPSVMNTRKGFLDALEVKVVLSVLRSLDNPLQDVDLLSMMRLPIFNLSVNEIAMIKDPDNYSHYLYSIFKFLNENKDDSPLYKKVKTFKSVLYELRTYAKYHSVEEVLRKIYKDLEIEAFFMSMSMKYTRQANLTGLIDKAIEFNAQGHHSIHEFVVAMDHLKSRKKDFGEESFVSEDNAVKIMTIHASKGLEFKHVIYADTHTKFNYQSAGGRIVIDSTYGFGMDIPHVEVENELYGYEKTFYNDLVKEKMKQKMLGEELRKMYVAFTRAEDSLHIPLLLQSDADMENTLDDNREEDSESRSQGSAAKFIYEVIAQYKSDMDQYVSIEDKKEFESQQIVDDHDNSIDKTTDKTPNQPEEKAKKPIFHPGVKVFEKTIKKVSVTELKRMSQALDAEMQGEKPVDKQIVAFPQPKNIFTSTEPSSIATMTGTIVHEIMMRAVDGYKPGLNTDELVDNAINATEEANGDISFLKDKNKLDAKEFFKNKKIVELLQAADLLTEQPFFADYSIVKDSHYKDSFIESQDGSLFEGIIDLLIKKNDDWYIIIDYKTDTAKNSADNSELLNKYKAQLNLYKAVVQHLTGASRVDAYLYGFNYDEPVIEVENIVD
ncbi:hypothetical protein ETI10_00235 [Macrococcoides goetzii]|nr:UvrD-helicase domain-containing protein [Macrococcus goetzii]TDM41548.1 hypothetical protein ETI10_00235 [Macrococcus goetzii]